MKPTPTPDLLPCPFCGSTNLKTGGDDKVVGVWCLTCQAAGPNHYGSREWNDRALSQPAEAVVGEPVAWLSQHKLDKESFWLSRPNEPEGSHWSAAFPVYRAAPSAPEGEILAHLHLIRCFADEINERNWDDKALYIKQQVDRLSVALGGKP